MICCLCTNGEHFEPNRSTRKRNIAHDSSNLCANERVGRRKRQDIACTSDSGHTAADRAGRRRRSAARRTRARAPSARSQNADTTNQPTKHVFPAHTRDARVLLCGYQFVSACLIQTPSRGAATLRDLCGENKTKTSQQTKRTETDFRSSNDTTRLTKTSAYRTHTPCEQSANSATQFETSNNESNRSIATTGSDCCCSK